MFKEGQEVWVRGYITVAGQRIDVSTSGVVMETQICRRSTLLVRLRNFDGCQDVVKRVLCKFVFEL